MGPETVCLAEVQPWPGADTHWGRAGCSWGDSSAAESSGVAAMGLGKLAACVPVPPAEGRVIQQVPLSPGAGHSVLCSQTGSVFSFSVSLFALFHHADTG